MSQGVLQGSNFENCSLLG